MTDGVLIPNTRFHPHGTWLWAMRQLELGYTVFRPGTDVRIPPVGDWSICAKDAIAEDWAIEQERDEAPVSSTTLYT